MSTLCTERRSVDHTSSTKQKITLVEGKLSWTRFCAHLKNTTKQDNAALKGERSNVQKVKKTKHTHVSGRVSGMARSTGILSLR